LALLVTEGALETTHALDFYASSSIKFHCLQDQSNRRKYMPDYAVWEIHPVMALQVVH
jgi:hypothetical protein